MFAAVSGCDLPSSSTVSDTQIPPSILEASIAPTNVDFGKLIITGTTVDISVIGYVNVIDDNGLNDIASVTYTVYSPAGKLIASGTLSDNGVLPDANASDGKFNSFINLKLPKDIIGVYNIQFSASDKKGLTSNIFNLPLKIIYSLNHAPAISNLSCPDTIVVPESGTNFIQAVISASDLEGTVDIKSVNVTIIRPNTPEQPNDSSVVAVYSLFDDGGSVAVPPFGISSGDNIAGDGVYSLILPVPATTLKNIYRYFSFIAVDQSNAASNEIVKKVYFK